VPEVLVSMTLKTYDIKKIYFSFSPPYITPNCSCHKNWINHLKLGLHDNIKYNFCNGKLVKINWCFKNRIILDHDYIYADGSNCLGYLLGTMLTGIPRVFFINVWDGILHILIHIPTQFVSSKNLHIFNI
jgi:hypothetical protein